MSDRVTQTNREIISLLYSGVGYKNVADQLKISYWTVVRRVQQMKESLGCTTVTQLVAKYKTEYEVEFASVS